MLVTFIRGLALVFSFVENWRWIVSTSLSLMSSSSIDISFLTNRRPDFVGSSIVVLLFEKNPDDVLLLADITSSASPVVSELGEGFSVVVSVQLLRLPMLLWLLESNGVVETLLHV